MRGWLAPLLLFGTLASACSVGWPYSYRGTEYRMTQSSIDYHKKVVADVQQKFGVLLGGAHVQPADVMDSKEALARQIPELREQAKRFRGACAYVTAAAAQGPDGGGFTSAGSLLTDDARETCRLVEDATRQVTKAEDALARKDRELQAADERQRAQKERDRAQQEAARKQASLAALTGALRACSRDWAPAPNACASPDIDDEARATCEKTCAAAAARTFSKALDDAKQACISDVVSQGATKGCALKKPDGSALDDAALATAAKKCSDDCKTEGLAARRTQLERQMAEKQAESLVTAYKLCMVAAYRQMPTPYRFDRGLRQNYMTTSRNQCRAGSRCDWVESKTSSSCSSDVDP